MKPFTHWKNTLIERVKWITSRDIIHRDVVKIVFDIDIGQD